MTECHLTCVDMMLVSAVLDPWWGCDVANMQKDFERGIYLHCKLAGGCQDKGIGGRHAFVSIQQPLQDGQREGCCLARACNK